MKYLSLAQIHESLQGLQPFNMFYGTTFLVLKREVVPIGSMKRIDSLDAATRNFLQTHYQIHPKSKMFFRALRQGSKTKDWLDSKYASSGLQAINTQTFRDALLHEPHSNAWGWSTDYLHTLIAKLPNGVRIPLFDLAAWIYKNLPWDDQSARKDVCERFIREFQLTSEELQNLFQPQLVSSLTEEAAFHTQPAKWSELLAPFSRPPDVPADASGILTYLETSGIGPARQMVLEPGPRLNLVTGDNGLGKTFLLDIAWWTLTQEWVERPATPIGPKTSPAPLINFAIAGTDYSARIRATYAIKEARWLVKQPRSAMSGLAVYARVDGSFAVWDPAKGTSTDASSLGAPSSTFTRDEVWNGDNKRIQGLINDWSKWQLGESRYAAFGTLSSLVQELSPPDLGPMRIGELTRIPGDHREIPTLVHPYGSVPILFESAGIRRILTLAYLLVWAWEEHKVHARQRGLLEDNQMIVLIDEVEAHLHPKWQRVIVPALLSAAKALRQEMSVQWLIASHSALVLASCEALWSDETDRLFDIDMTSEGDVTLKSVDFEQRGTVDSWLSSDVFELRHPGSKEREDAIEAALRLQSSLTPRKEDVAEVDELLRKHLPDEDLFWLRWAYFADTFGVDE